MGLHMIPPPPPSDCEDMDFVMGPRKVHIAEPEFVSDPYTALEIEAQPGFSVERPRVLSVLSNLLEKLVARNEARALSGGSSGRPYSSKLTVFHGLRAPTISIEKYLERIFKYANCSPACFVVAYVYIDRLMQRQPDLPITSLNVHRLLITSVMTAAKFLDDAFYCNSFYGKVGGVTTAEMNRLELEFLFRLDFRLNVTTATFDAYTCHLEKELIRSGGYQIERPLTPRTPPICDIVTCSSEAAYTKQKLALSPSSAFASNAIAVCGAYPYSR